MISSSKKTLIGYGLVSPLHVANFMSYFYSKPSTYDNIVICINNYWGESILPHRYIEFLKSVGIKIKHIDSYLSIKPVINDYNNIDLVLLGGFDWKIILRTNSKVKSLILIDEGLSSYRSYSSIKRDSPKIKLYKVLISKLISKVSIFTFRKRTEVFRTFNSGDFDINPIYKKGLFKYFSNLKVFYNLESADNYSNTVLYCSQPWVDLGLVSETEYIKSIKSIKAKVENKGSLFLLKRHPAEKVIDYSKYSINTLEDSRMLEEIFFSSKFEAIISKNSTSSFMLPALYTSNSYLTDMSEVNKLGPKAEKIFKRYCYDIEDLF